MDMNTSRNDYSDPLRAVNGNVVRSGLRPLRYNPGLAARRPTNSLIRPVIDPARVVERQQAPVLLRDHLGEVLRLIRTRQGRTLRDVSSTARVSLGYLSEVERGQKEASSELLGSICQALRVPLWYVAKEAADRIAIAQNVSVPDTVPDDFDDLDDTLSAV